MFWNGCESAKRMHIEHCLKTQNYIQWDGVHGDDCTMHISIAGERARWRQRYQYGSRRERVAKRSEWIETDIRTANERTRDRQVRRFYSVSQSASDIRICTTADNRGNTSTLSAISFDFAVERHPT